MLLMETPVRQSAFIYYQTVLPWPAVGLLQRMARPVFFKSGFYD
jgi:hypothetical protein